MIKRPFGTTVSQFDVNVTLMYVHMNNVSKVKSKKLFITNGAGILQVLH